MLLLLIAAGCTGAPKTPDRPASSPSAVLSTPSTAQGDADGVGAAPSSTPDPVAVLAAERYVTAWARPGLTPSAWYAALRPLATPGYAQLLADTDPTNVPAHAVTGPARVLSSSTAVVVAEVPTDAGPVRVTVADRGGRWLIDTVRPAPPTPGDRS